MKIKSLSVLPSAKGYLAVIKNDLFVPEYIALAVVENNNADGIVPLAISDLWSLGNITNSLSNFELKIEGDYIETDTVSSMLIPNISLHTGAVYIHKEAVLTLDIEEAKEKLINMANRAGVKYDKRIKKITSIEDCKKIVSKTFRKV